MRKRKLLSLLVLLMTAATGAWAQDYDINVDFDNNYNPMETHFICSIMNQMMEPGAEINGTLDLSVDGDSKGSFDVNGGMCIGVICPSLDAGDHTWSAVFKPEGGSYNANGNFTIDKAYTFIVYDGSTSINMGVGESTEVDVYLNPNEPGELSYSSSDASVASITKKEYSYDTYIIQANAAGTATITFSFAGNTNYDAADIKTITVTVEPASPTDPSGSFASGVTWALTLSSGVMTISGTGAMDDYTLPDETPWYSNKDAITSVVIESGVTHIGNAAFHTCSNLTSVTIPEGVTSIGDAAFFTCPSLTSVTIPSSVTSIGESAFSWTGLTTVDIPTGVTSIEDGVFAVCSALTSVTIPNGVTSIGNSAFTHSGLTSVDIPAGVTSIGSYAFADCSDLETITLNSNPFIDDDAFDNIKDGATVTMNLPANLADGAKWTTFYNEKYSFVADANTQVFKVQLSGTELTMYEVEDKITQEQSGYVLKTTGDGNPNPVMTLTNETTSDNVTSHLKGVAVPDGLTADDDGYIFVLNYTAANGVGFYRLASGKKLGVGKAFLYYNGSGSGAREFFGFGDASGIESVSVNENENGEVYDLQGRRVSQPTKGLYIVNGKKVVIK